MTKNITSNIRAFKRYTYAFGALALLVAVAFPAFHNGIASADQLSTRSITLSDSGVSGGAITSGIGSGTGVTYRVSFKNAHSASSMVIDFCSNDPIISDTCDSPVGMDVSGAGLSTVSGESDITAAGWTVTHTGSAVNTGSSPTNLQHLQIQQASGTAATAAVQHSFDITGITNPSPACGAANSGNLCSFYARIYTYADNTEGGSSTAYSNPTTLGNYVDYGGVALSTNNIISITARVQETLTFCVSGTNPTANSPDDCTTATAPAITLGHGTPTAVLDAQNVDAAEVWTQLSTNATNGAVIAMRNNNACGGLSANGGSTCDIPPINSGGTGPNAITAGTAAFGLLVGGSSTATGGTGTVTPNTEYWNGTDVAATVATSPNAGTGHYAMDTTNTTRQTLPGNPAPTNTIDTFGGIIAAATAPCYKVDNPLVFAATAALTTPAGIYTANMDLVATGTF